MRNARDILAQRVLLFDGGMGTYYKGRPGQECEQALSLLHIPEPTRRTPIPYAAFCLKKKKPLYLYCTASL